MIRSLALLLIFVLSLSALSNKNLLKRADGFIKSSNKSNQFRAYNDYKNLYLRALMNDDRRFKKSALVGIVKSGQKLHIDVSQYADELASIEESSHKKSKPKKIKKRTSKLQIKSTHKLKSIHWKNERLVMRFNKKLRNNQINYFTLYDSKIFA